jgi:hypothetical protein
MAGSNLMAREQGLTADPRSDLVREVGVFLLICSMAAAALYALGSRPLFAWGWPLVLATFFLACAGSLLANLKAGLAFLHPRALRIQLAIELALFHATGAQAVSCEAALQYLRKARRAAGRMPLRGKLDSIIDRVRSGARETTPVIACELQAILREISPSRAGRLPFQRYLVLPAECLAPLSFIVAVIGVVALPVTSAGNPATVDGVLQGTVLFGLTFEGLRLLRIITFKVHDLLSNQAFRVIIIGAIADRTFASRLAEALYPQIGHVVHVLIRPNASEPTFELHESGKYWLITSPAGVSDALIAFAHNADLLVLDGGDLDLARTVRMTTALPDSRYLALSKSGASPPGYRWIEPLALRARLRSDPNADPYRLCVLPGSSIWSDWLFQLLIFASLVLATVDGGTLLAVLAMLGALGRRFPDQIGSARRSLISRTTLRAPSAPRFSQRLVPRVLERYLWITMILLALPALFSIHPSFDFGSDRASGLKLIVAAHIALLACFFAVSGILIAVKWSIDRNFRILVLRRNARRYGYGHKAFVMATCGKYGQVISIRDPTLDQTDDDYGEWRESSHGSWFRIFAEISSMVRPVGILDTWQRRILMELEVSDFAVFDWVDEITENMKWELLSAAERLPAHRMLIVCSPEREQSMRDAIASCGELLSGTPHCLIAARGGDDEYIWANHDSFDEAFRRRLHESLSALVTEPRRCIRVQVGAWPYPVRSTR